MNRVKSKVKLILTGIVIGFVNGLFGSGGGTVAVPAMEKYLDFEEHDSHATAIFVILPLAVTSSIVYYTNGYFKWDLIWKVSIGGVIGGFIGALLLNIAPTVWIRRIFALFLAIAAVRLIF